MSIQKAVIAAAGWSTRFLPSVKTYAKHLVPVWDRPNIQYQVESCLANGITNICIVHRPGEDTIKKHFSPEPILEQFLQKVGKTHFTSNLNHIINSINFTFLEQSPTLPYGNATPFLVAKDFIGQDPFVYFYGDDLIVEPIIGNYLGQMLSKYQDQKTSAVVASLLVDQVQIQKLSSIKFRPDHSVEAVIEKPSPEDIYSLNALVSPFVLPSKIVDITKSLPPVRNEIWCTDAINQLAKTDLVLSQEVKEGFWTTTGDPESWLLANISVAILQRPELKSKIQSLLS